MVLATMHTGHFEFIVLADTEENAIDLMKKAWDRHVEREGGWEWAFVESSVFVTFIRQGDILRDGTLIHSYDVPAPHWLHN